MDTDRQPNFNPFNPNSVVVPRLFAGRADTVLDICKRLSQLSHNMPASFFIHGERGIGKTALAKLIRSVAVAKDKDLHNLNLLTTYYSVESKQDLSSVLQAALNSLTDQMDKTVVEEIGSRLGSLFQNGKFSLGAFGATIGVEGRSADQHHRDITIKDQTVSILGNIVKAINEKEAQDGILIILDEIHNLKNLQAAASVFRNISTTLDVEGMGKVAFLLIGYDDDVDLFFSEDSSARRTFDLHPLSVMPPEEAVEIIKKGLSEAKYQWDDSALINNIDAAGGYPHSIQMLGNNLIEVDTDHNIDGRDWSQAIMRSATQLQSKEFSKMYSFGKPLTEKDKILVTLALDSRKSMSRKEIGDKSTSSNIYQELKILKDLGAIKEGADKKISLRNQIFRTAILFDHFTRQFVDAARTSQPPQVVT